ncbi:MAG: hypothetical protein QOF51_1034, partial [Chloroflexota bacterium]|nr:hypothetical protein [Chloroflexota bacterium]
MAERLCLLVGEEQGVRLLASEDEGRTWAEPETLLAGVHACTLAAAPDGSVYVGTRGEGLFRVAPGLRSHEQVETPAELSKVRSLCITGDQFLAGTEPAQVYSWEDRKRWVPFGDVRQVSGTPEWWYPVQGEDPHVRHLSADPHRSGQFYGSLQVGGIAITPDGGDTWHDRRNLDLDVHMVQAHPAKPGTVYAGSGGKGLFRSHDWGESWENIAGTT